MFGISLLPFLYHRLIIIRPHNLHVLYTESRKRVSARLSAELETINKIHIFFVPDEDPPAEGKILFKKPAKRSSDKFEGISASSNSKKKKSENEEKKKESGVKVKNSSLLSFGDDEEEED